MQQCNSNVAQTEGRFIHATCIIEYCYAVCRCLLTILVMLTVFVSGVCLAGEPVAAETSEASKPVLFWETGAGKSYLIPALEIPAFLVLLNGYARLAYPDSVEPDGKKHTIRTCQLSGITSSTSNGGSTRTPSP